MLCSILTEESSLIEGCWIIVIGWLAAHVELYTLGERLSAWMEEEGELPGRREGGKEGGSEGGRLGGIQLRSPHTTKHQLAGAQS